MGCSPPGSFVHGILQARVLEWVAISSSRGSSWPRDWTRVSFISCIGRQILHHLSHLGRPLNAPITSSLSTSAPALPAAWECRSALGPHPHALTVWLTDCSPSFELVASSGHTSRGIMEGVGTSAVNLDVSSSLPLCLFSASNKLPGPVFFIFFLSLIASVTWQPTIPTSTYFGPFLYPLTYFLPLQLWFTPHGGMAWPVGIFIHLQYLRKKCLWIVLGILKGQSHFFIL